MNIPAQLNERTRVTNTVVHVLASKMLWALEDRIGCGWGCVQGERITASRRHAWSE
jgi:hypothetical protein